MAEKFTTSLYTVILVRKEKLMPQPNFKWRVLEERGISAVYENQKEIQNLRGKMHRNTNASYHYLEPVTYLCWLVGQWYVSSDKNAVFYF